MFIYAKCCSPQQVLDPVDLQRLNCFIRLFSLDTIITLACLDDVEYV